MTRAAGSVDMTRATVQEIAPATTADAARAASAAMSPDEEVRALEARLNSSCLFPLCNGDVPYAACFSRSSMTRIIESNAICQGILNEASSEAIRVAVLSRARANRIVSSLNDYCAIAGGAVVVDSCEFTIVFRATANTSDMHKSEERIIERDIRRKVGDVVNCDAASFPNLPDEDMFYRTKIDAEQQGQLMTSAISIATSGIELVTTSIHNASLAKEMKAMDQGANDAVFTFNRNGAMTPKCVVSVRGHSNKVIGGAEDARKACEAAKGTGCTLPKSKESTGWVSTGHATGSGNGSECSVGSGGSGLKDCASAPKDDESSCEVLITNASAAAVAQKRSELMATRTNLETLRSAANTEARTNARNARISDIMLNQQVMGIQSAITPNSGGPAERCAAGVSGTTYWPQTERDRFGNAVTTGFRINNGSDIVNSLPVDSTPCSLATRLGAGVMNCGPMGYRWNDTLNCYVSTEGSSGGGGAAGGQITRLRDNHNTGLGADMETFADNLNYIDETWGQKDDKIAAFNQAQSNLLQAQGAVADHQDRRASLQSQRDENTQSMINSGVNLLAQDGLGIIMTLQAAKDNKSRRTGQCYLRADGNERSFAREGEQKRLGWKNN